MGNERRADRAGRYEIRLEGHLAPRWESWFDGLTVSDDRNGITVISGSVADQSALHGVLQKVRDVGLPLLSVTRVDESIVERPAPTNHEPERK